MLNDNNHGLNKQINHWLSDFTQSTKYKILTRKYFTPYNTKNIPDLESRYKKISPYDLKKGRIISTIKIKTVYKSDFFIFKIIK